MNPVITHTKINQPALPTLRVISALTIKIPEPIMEPATIIVASSNPNDRLNDLSSCIASVGVSRWSDMDFDFWIKILKKLRATSCGKKASRCRRKSQVIILKLHSINTWGVSCEIPFMHVICDKQASSGEMVLRYSECNPVDPRLFFLLVIII